MRSFAYPAALAVSALAAALSAPASAQDAAPFTGLRVEGLAGVDQLQNDGHKRDFGYGVAVGYDVQRHGAVVGVEAEAADSNVRQCAGAATVADPRLCGKAARDLYVGARVGAAVAPRTLLYAKAGYTNARLKLTSNDGVDETTLGRSNLDGVRVGAGVEQQLFAKAYIKAEYRYSNYQDHYSRQQVLGGFGVRF